METTPILIRRPDGGVSIMRIVVSAAESCFPAVRMKGKPVIGPMGGVLKDGIWTLDTSDARIEVEIARAQIPCLSWERISEDDVPADPASRAFRDAWRHNLTIDMPMARDIHRQRLREARAPLLAALDVEQMRALESGKGAAAVAARKQALRDVTKDPAIDAAQTPEELAAVIPAALATGG